MITHTPEPQAAVPSPSAGETKPAPAPAPKLNVRGVIEVASSGTGSTNDTSGTYKPPGIHDSVDPTAGL
jgi:hypothetical protein